MSLAPTGSPGQCGERAEVAGIGIRTRTAKNAYKGHNSPWRTVYSAHA